MQQKLPVSRRSVEDLDLLVVLGECDLRGVGVPGVRRDGGHAKGEGCLRASHGSVMGIILSLLTKFQKFYLHSSECTSVRRSRTGQSTRPPRMTRVSKRIRGCSVKATPLML